MKEDSDRKELEDKQSFKTLTTKVDHLENNTKLAFIAFANTINASKCGLQFLFLLLRNLLPLHLLPLEQQHHNHRHHQHPANLVKTEEGSPNIYRNQKYFWWQTLLAET